MDQTASKDWEADCLGHDPFQGDFGDGERLLSDKIVTARKGGECHDCGGEIVPRTRVRRRVEASADGVSTYSWCEDCCRAQAIYPENPDVLDQRIAGRFLPKE